MDFYAEIQNKRVVRVVCGSSFLKSDPRMIFIPDNLVEPIKSKPTDWFYDGETFKSIKVKELRLEDVKRRIEADFMQWTMIENIARLYDKSEVLAFRDEWRQYIKDLVTTIRKKDFKNIPERPPKVLKALLDLDFS